MIDVAHSAQLVAKLKQFAEKEDIVVRYEAIKADIRKRYEESKQKYHFFRPFRSERPLADHLKETRDLSRSRRKKIDK